MSVHRNIVQIFQWGQKWWTDRLRCHSHGNIICVLMIYSVVLVSVCDSFERHEVHKLNVSECEWTTFSLWPFLKHLINHPDIFFFFHQSFITVSLPFCYVFFFLSPKQWLEFKEESLWTSQDDKTEIFWCAAQLNQCQLCLQPRQRVGVAFHIIWARGAFEAAWLRFVNDNRGRKSLLAAPEHIQRLVLFLCWLIDWYNTCRTSSGKPVQYFLWV